VNVKLDKKAGVGQLDCRVCGQKFQCAVNCMAKLMVSFSRSGLLTSSGRPFRRCRCLRGMGRCCGYELSCKTLLRDDLLTREQTRSQKKIVLLPDIRAMQEHRARSGSSTVELRTVTTMTMTKRNTKGMASWLMMKWYNSSAMYKHPFARLDGVRSAVIREADLIFSAHET
jgi:hypothetical protein